MSFVRSTGFADPGLDSQRVFRAVMAALACPAQPVALPVSRGLAPPPGLATDLAAVLLTLADFETAIWLDPPAAAKAETGSYLQFHTGARITSDPLEADFAVITEPVTMPALSQFAQGSHDYPDRSATLIVEVDRFLTDDWTLRGPGIDGARRFGVAPLPASFATQWAANTASFPLGVDMVFVAYGQVAGLPRSTRLVES